jgi:DNA mismatch repair protein MutS
MKCPSILYNGQTKNEKASADTLKDLRLDRVFESIAAGREKYRLEEFYLSLLKDSESIKYRQEVSKDIEDERIFKALKEFSNGMEKVRRLMKMVEKLDYE